MKRNTGIHSEPGFSLIELMVTVGIIGLLSAIAFLSLNNANQSRGVECSATLKTVWIEQKRVMVESMASPNTAPNPNTYTLATVVPNQAAQLAAPAWTDRYGTINVAVIPPTSTFDGAKRDTKKTSPTTGDGLFDVGRER